MTDINTLEATGGVSWREGQDHSKWCVTTNRSNRLCVCDINRMTTQRIRGGGCTCFMNANLFSQLNNTITNADSCK